MVALQFKYALSANAQRTILSYGEAHMRTADAQINMSYVQSELNIWAQLFKASLA